MKNNFDDFFKSIENKEYWKKLNSYIDTIYKDDIVCPNKEVIYRCFNFVFSKEINVVILGQDPYPKKGDANGLAFSVDRNNKLPPSLNNIFKELKNDLRIDRNNGDLSDWAKQGVLLLNTSLTFCKKNQELGKKSWEPFTTDLIKWIDKINSNIIFILWGGEANKFSKYIVNNKKNIISSGHPSFANAHGKFFGTKPFSKCNSLLIKMNKKPILWGEGDDKTNFLWGASIANYQTDGCENTQWAKWERENAERLAKNYLAEYSYLNHSNKIKQEATSVPNYICGSGIKHRENYKSDIVLFKKLGWNAFRFSIEWAKIEPSQGKYNMKEIMFIKKYIQELKQNGITPVVTLWHWTAPLWFTDKGAFENKKNIKYFIDYCKFVLEQLKNCIKYILVLNEVMIYACCSYYIGLWPPMKKNLYTTVRVSKNLANAFNVISKEAKKINNNFLISIAHNTTNYNVLDKKIKSKLLSKILIWFGDYFFLNKTYKNMDFLGINWYGENIIENGEVKSFVDTKYTRSLNHNELADNGWKCEPAKISTSLKRLYKKYHLPIMISENGLADANDKKRIVFIKETLKSIDECKENGVRFIGYLHWSAFDNFEWDKGFWPKFGLIEASYINSIRTPRKSALWYCEEIKRRIKK